MPSGFPSSALFDRVLAKESETNTDNRVMTYPSPAVREQLREMNRGQIEGKLPGIAAFAGLVSASKPETSLRINASPTMALNPSHQPNEILDSHGIEFLKPDDSTNALKLSSLGCLSSSSTEIAKSDLSSPHPDQVIYVEPNYNSMPECHYTVSRVYNPASKRIKKTY